MTGRPALLDSERARYFIAELGVDPEDGDWERIGRDWVRPADREARERLYREIIAARRRAAAPAIAAARST